VEGAEAPEEGAEAPEEAESCTDEPEPANDDRPDQPDGTNEPEPPAEPAHRPEPPVPTPPLLEAPPKEVNGTIEPEPLPPPTTPMQFALVELARLRCHIAERWPTPMHATVETFLLKYGSDGLGPPAWVQDLPACSQPR
jgi:hypothetical protein